MKRGHDTRICQVENGLVVKIGCQIIVADIDELPLLVDYYNGEVPKGYKQLFKGMATHINGDAPEEVPMEDRSGIREFYGAEELLDGRNHSRVYPVKNGYVIVKPEGTFIARTTDKMCVILMNDQLPEKKRVCDNCCQDSPSELGTCCESCG